MNVVALPISESNTELQGLAAPHTAAGCKGTKPADTGARGCAGRTADTRSRGRRGCSPPGPPSVPGPTHTSRGPGPEAAGQRDGRAQPRFEYASCNIVEGSGPDAEQQEEARRGGTWAGARRRTRARCRPLGARRARPAAASSTGTLVPRRGKGRAGAGVVASGARHLGWECRSHAASPAAAHAPSNHVRRRLSRSCPHGPSRVGPNGNWEDSTPATGRGQRHSA